MIKKSHAHHLSTVLDLKEDLKSYTHAAMYTTSEVSLLQQFDKSTAKCTRIYKKTCRLFLSKKSEMKFPSALCSSLSPRSAFFWSRGSCTLLTNKSFDTKIHQGFNICFRVDFCGYLFWAVNSSNSFSGSGKENVLVGRDRSVGCHHQLRLVKRLGKFSRGN